MPDVEWMYPMGNGEDEQMSDIDRWYCPLNFSEGPCDFCWKPEEEEEMEAYLQEHYARHESPEDRAHNKRIEDRERVKQQED